MKRVLFSYAKVRGDMMDEYKKIECISKMEEDFQNAFEEIVNGYRDKLAKRVVFPGSAFTLHDFEHHCFNIYKIISDVLFDNKLVYLSDYGLCQRELFILNLAVLFHDIGMANVLGATRENHSLKSAEYIQTEYNDSRSVFRKKADLTANELKALKAIVVAHSNIKDGSVDVTQNGLNSPNLKDYPAKSGIIRTKFLAGILRIADELDVSAERLGTGEIEQEIEERKNDYEKMGKIDDTEEWKGYLCSLRHWKKLHLIAYIKGDKKGEVIELHIDDDYVMRCLDEGQTEKSLAREIVDVYSEIEKKFAEAERIAFSSSDVSKYVAVKSIKLVTSMKVIEKEIQDNLSVKSLKQIKRDEEVDVAKVVENKMPRVIDLQLEKELFDEINQRGLIKFGHYLLNENFCARDWIDTREVVETKKILHKLVEAIVKDINSKKNKDLIVIGVDLVGALLASRVAFSLQCPLTYIVSEKDEKNNATQEIEIDINQGRDIVLITDAIVTYDTIRRAVDKYSLENKIDSIYTIFYRPSEVNGGEFIGKTFSINNLFKIELFPKTKCIYNKDKCKALNRKICGGNRYEGD